MWALAWFTSIFVLAKNVSVIENIIVGTKIKGVWVNLEEARQKIKQLCNLYGIELELDAIVGQLSVGKQQWVEILKSLFVGVDLLILDEPTASLTPQEVHTLFNILLRMKEKGLSIILITHKLREVFEISDRGNSTA